MNHSNRSLLHMKLASSKCCFLTPTTVQALTIPDQFSSLTANKTHVSPPPVLGSPRDKIGVRGHVWVVEAQTWTTVLYRSTR